MDQNDRILVTGANGFIGGRLVEVLAKQGLRVRVATSDFQHCSRASRFPIELVKADLRDHASLARAVKGCSILFHCAYQFGGDAKDQQQVNLDGTRALADEFLKASGRRFVHISSVAAYGDPRDGDLTEETTPRPTDEPYSDTKRKIDRVLQELHRRKGLPVTILQPTIVYGPYGTPWTTRVLEQVRSTQFILPASGKGLCNAVYIDDVVTAMLLATQCDAAIGETFLISARSPEAWRDFYGSYEAMLGKKTVITMDNTQVQREEHRQRRSQSLLEQLRRGLAKRPHIRSRLLSIPPHGWVLAGGRRILPRAVRTSINRAYESLWQVPMGASEDLPVHLPAGWMRALYEAKTYVRIDKACTKLGYNPAFDLKAGMARTAEWARWANLVPA